MTKDEWRNCRIHRKCKFCTHCRTNVNRISINVYYTCIIKDKVINKELHKFFCPCFEVNSNDSITTQKGLPIPPPPPPLPQGRDKK